MHNYSKLNNSDLNVYFGIAVISFILSIIIGIYFKNIVPANPKDVFQILFAGYPLAIYGGLYWLFNNYAWKVINKILKIPNLNGKYIGTLQSSYDEFKSAINFELEIQQSFSKILIIFKTKTSKSKSLSASIELLGSKVILVYNYHNKPQDLRASTLNEHKGTAWLEFDLSINEFEGFYYTDKRPIDSDKAVCNYGMIKGKKIK